MHVWGQLDIKLHAASARTLTTLELALPCSYARNAVFTIGNVDIRETKSGSSSGSDGLVDLEDIDNAGVGWNAANESVDLFL